MSRIVAGLTPAGLHEAAQPKMPQRIEVFARRASKVAFFNASAFKAHPLTVPVTTFLEQIISLPLQPWARKHCVGLRRITTTGSRVLNSWIYHSPIVAMSYRHANRDYPAVRAQAGRGWAGGPNGSGRFDWPPPNGY